MLAGTAEPYPNRQLRSVIDSCALLTPENLSYTIEFRKVFINEVLQASQELKRAFDEIDRRFAKVAAFLELKNANPDLCPVSYKQNKARLQSLGLFSVGPDSTVGRLTRFFTERFAKLWPAKNH